MGWVTKDNPLIAMADIISFMLESLCPVLSGNMKAHIEVTEMTDHSVTLCINAPFYDTKEWKKTGNIIYTGSPKKWPQFTDYAMWVNKNGAFSKGNKSMHWVNRVCYDGANIIGNTMGAVVINYLDLS